MAAETFLCDEVLGVKVAPAFNRAGYWLLVRDSSGEYHYVSFSPLRVIVDASYHATVEILRCRDLGSNLPTSEGETDGR